MGGILIGFHHFARPAQNDENKTKRERLSEYDSTQKCVFGRWKGRPIEEAVAKFSFTYYTSESRRWRRLQDRPQRDLSGRVNAKRGFSMAGIDPCFIIIRLGLDRGQPDLAHAGKETKFV